MQAISLADALGGLDRHGSTCLTTNELYRFWLVLDVRESCLLLFLEDVCQLVFAGAPLMWSDRRILVVKSRYGEVLLVDHPFSTA